MDITHILVQEHCIIEQVLHCLEKIAERCERDRVLESEAAQEAIGFLRSFVERCHDFKVETRLLPIVQAMGIQREHNEGCSIQESREDARVHLDAMEAAIELVRAGNAAAVDSFIEHARTYIGELLDCIARQEDSLFPQINNRAGGRKPLPQRAEDRDCATAGVCDAYVEIANRLADKLGVPRVAAARQRTRGLIADTERRERLAADARDDRR